MKFTNVLGVVLVSLVVAGCGGGDAQDATGFIVNPTEVAYKCVPGRSGLSIHTISGGREPFRVRTTTTSTNLLIGLADSNNEFVPATLNPEGDLILKGRDPKFAVLTDLSSCGSKVSIQVIDDTSAFVFVEIEVEEAEAAQ